ncbi:MAG: ABC transporter ATP-binding protein [Candidatus Geothermarchaeales archaeon]
MLEVGDINAGYGRLQVLFDINATIRDKDITVLVGPNGSGKSTLLKTVFGLTKIYSGRILLDGHNLVGSSPHEVAKMGIAYLPQVENIFSNLRVRENLIMAGYLLDKEEARERADEVLESFPILKQFYQRRAGTLSGGERQMLAMAIALMRRPKIMLFDEPTSSLTPGKAKKVIEGITNLRDNYGITVVIAEQNAKRALEYGDEALLLVSGRIMFDGRASDLLAHEEFGKVYLGISRA